MQCHLDLRRFEQFVERRPHPPHFHLPFVLLLPARGGLFLLKVRQSLHHVGGHGCQHLDSLFRIERHDGCAPFLGRAVEDLSELLSRQQFVQVHTGERDNSRRELREILRENIGSFHADGCERFQSGFECRVFRNSLGVQLEFDPLLDSQPSHRFDVSGARAESQAVERLPDSLFGGELNVEPRGCIALARSAVCGKHCDGRHQKHAFDHPAIPPRSV